jgi:Na+/H+-dicarboxylate symporter
MFRLALHWQILIGMLFGSLCGVLVNMFASERSVNVRENLPAGIERFVSSDTASRSMIEIQRSGGEISRYTIDPLGKQGDFRSLDDLRKVDSTAVDLFLRDGQSMAKRIGAWCQRIGGLFLRMLQMVAVPLIVTSLLTGILGLGDGEGVGRMFRYTISYYLSTSLLAIITGLAAVNLIRPGLSRIEAGAIGEPKIDAAKPLGEVLFDQLEAMIPANPLAALTEPNFLSIIAFTIAFALFTLSVGGQTLERIRAAAMAGFDVMMAMTTAIIRLAPLGVLFLIAAVTATQGLEIFITLGWYVIAVALALAVHALITLPLILKFIAKRSPWEYAKAMSPALLTAFSSASSNGTLPLTMSNVEKRARISNKTGSFVLPLGATVNMDGTALYEAVAVLFIAQLHFGQNLPFAQQVIVAITALLASVGAAGIPHAGLVMMVIILQAVGLPIEMQGVILAVDRVLDMARTSVNVWSDSCGCAVVEQLVQTQK